MDNCNFHAAARNVPADQTVEEKQFPFIRSLLFRSQRKTAITFLPVKRLFTFGPYFLTMVEEKSLNFLEEIVENDLKAGKYQTIITRFPPEPNGYLHMGHAKSICLNFGLANRYGGYTNLRFDDTNPVTEDVEYVESIKNDVKWLGFQWQNEFYASDYFTQLYGFS